MYCQNRIVHTIEQGDSLYRLARQYDTTVTELILGNPGVNPYNLQIGMKLQICPGRGYEGTDTRIPYCTGKTRHTDHTQVCRGCRGYAEPGMPGAPARKRGNPE